MQMLGRHQSCRDRRSARRHSGVITQVDHEALVRIAEAGDCVLTLRPALGEFVPAGAPLFEIAGATERLNVNAAIQLHRTRP